MRCVFLLALFVTLCLADISSLTEEIIRCKVCERAVTHVWERGVQLRQHCREHGPAGGADCDYHSVNSAAVDQMVWGVCHALPTTYQALHESEFDLVLHDDPQHPEHIAQLIKQTCIKFLHDEHGVEYIARLVAANLDAGKTTAMILDTFKNDFCARACSEEHLEL